MAKGKLIRDTSERIWIGLHCISHFVLYYSQYIYFQYLTIYPRISLIPHTPNNLNTDYRKGIPCERATSAFDRKLQWVQLWIRGPRWVFARGLRAPSPQDTTCIRYIGRTRRRFRNFQPCQGSRNRRELLKNDYRLFHEIFERVTRERLGFHVIAVFYVFRLYLLSFSSLFGICWSIWIIREDWTMLIITLTLKWII